MNELYHFGIKGMKWGVRRYQNKDGSLTSAGKRRYNEKEASTREKLTNMSKRGRLSEFEKGVVDARNQDLSKRVTKAAAFTALSQLMVDAAMGNMGAYYSPKGLAKRAAGVAAGTAVSVKLNDYLAKSISKRYNQDGKLAEGQKRTDGKKEKRIMRSVQIAAGIAPVLLTLADMKYKQAQYNKAVNEARFRSWGGNIFRQKTRNVVWSDPDSDTYIYEP